MRVLKGGEGEKNWRGYVSCEKRHEHEQPGCGAVLEIESGDLTLMYWEDRASQHFYPAVRCPLCGKYTEAPRVPKTILENLVRSLGQAKAVFDGRAAA